MYIFYESSVRLISTNNGNDNRSILNDKGHNYFTKYIFFFFKLKFKKKK